MNLCITHLENCIAAQEQQRFPFTENKNHRLIAFLFQELGVLKFDQLIEFQILKIVLQFSNKIVAC